MMATLVPSAPATLACCRETLDRIVMPGCQTQAQRSAVATIVHLLRYVERRIDLEGDLLFAEIQRLRQLLGDIVDHPAVTSQPGRGSALCTRITETLRTVQAADVYPSVERLSAEVAVMRQHVSDTLTLLHSGAPLDAAASGLHATLREYLAWQLEQEARIVEPAFVGRGPRR